MTIMRDRRQHTLYIYSYCVCSCVPTAVRCIACVDSSIIVAEEALGESGARVAIAHEAVAGVAAGRPVIGGRICASLHHALQRHGASWPVVRRSQYVADRTIVGHPYGHIQGCRGRKVAEFHLRLHT